MTIDATSVLLQARAANAVSDKAKKSGASKKAWEDLLEGSQQGPITLRAPGKRGSREPSEDEQLQAAMQASMQDSPQAPVRPRRGAL